jgi:hypothetical protein
MESRIGASAGAGKRAEGRGRDVGAWAVFKKSFPLLKIILE